MGLIHGDLFVDNVLFLPTGEALSALLDFEQASWGRLAYDLAVTVLAFGFGRDDFRPEITRALIDAYVASRPPSAEERAAFGAELRFAACRFAVTRITDVHLKQGAGAAPGKRFQRYLARLASVRAHLDAADGLLSARLGSEAGFARRRLIAEIRARPSVAVATSHLRTMLMYLRSVSLRSSSRST